MNKLLNEIAEATAEAFIFFVSVLLANIILLLMVGGMVYFHYYNTIMQFFDLIRVSN